MREESIDLGNAVELSSSNPSPSWGGATSDNATTFSLKSHYSPSVAVLNIDASPGAPETVPAETSTVPTKKLSVAIPRDLHRLLKKIALDDDITMGQLITDLLSASLRASDKLT